MTHDPKSFRCEMQDIRAAKLCSGGARDWFRAHGISWSDFLSDGVSAQTLAKTNDPMALRVVVAAEKRNFPNG